MATKSSELRALSIKQPWAWAILHAGKDIENRTWTTKYRGPLLVHASKSMVRNADLPRGVKPQEGDLVCSAILGVVELVDVVDRSHSRWFEGPYGLVLKNPRPFSKPVTCNGWLGLWHPSSEVLRRVKKAIV